jgi:hypothetical protein
MKIMRRDLVDFYGNQADVAAHAALRLLENRGDLVESWSRQDALENGFSRWIRDLCPGTGADPVLSEIAKFSIRWAIHGMPRVLLSHRLAASLACTSIPVDFCDTVRMPWRFMEVVVPAGLLHNPLQSTILCREVVTPDGAGCRILFQHWASPECQKRTGHKISSQVACDRWSGFADLAEDAGVDLDAELRRSLGWHSRLILGCCLELQGQQSGPSPLAPRRSGSGRQGEPSAWNVVLKRHVTMDVRKHCKDYISGSGRKLGVQFVVHGHWKNQPCGPGARDRKFIHVEPYWRGPKDAPIAVRSHILKDLTPGRGPNERNER